jgi:DNA-binding NarL/FixJ family response regulator
MRALLLDDDPYALDLLQAILIERYPGLTIERRTEPSSHGSHDIFFLDDDFEGVRLAGELAHRIRRDNPGAIILAFSASLDASTLKELLAAGCNGVCDKKEQRDVPEMLDALDRCLDALQARRTQAPESMLRTFRELFREWNLRLERQAR